MFFSKIGTKRFIKVNKSKLVELIRRRVGGCKTHLPDLSGAVDAKRSSVKSSCFLFHLLPWPMSTGKYQGCFFVIFISQMIAVPAMVFNLFLTVVPIENDTFLKIAINILFYIILRASTN